MTNWEACAGGHEADRTGISGISYSVNVIVEGGSGNWRGRGSLKLGSTREEGRECKKNMMKTLHLMEKSQFNISMSQRKMRIPVCAVL